MPPKTSSASSLARLHPGRCQAPAQNVRIAIGAVVPDNGTQPSIDSDGPKQVRIVSDGLKFRAPKTRIQVNAWRWFFLVQGLDRFQRQLPASTLPIGPQLPPKQRRPFDDKCSRPRRQLTFEDLQVFEHELPRFDEALIRWGQW
jgi:hypothetical protein